jgi:hypothetical protein
MNHKMGLVGCGERERETFLKKNSNPKEIIDSR